MEPLVPRVSETPQIPVGSIDFKSLNPGACAVVLQEQSGISERVGSKGRMSLAKGDKSKQRDSYTAEHNGKLDL